jgi:hypothetical protein
VKEVMSQMDQLVIWARKKKVSWARRVEEPIRGSETKFIISKFIITKFIRNRVYT